MLASEGVRGKRLGGGGRVIQSIIEEEISAQKMRKKAKTSSPIVATFTFATCESTRPDSDVIGNTWSQRVGERKVLLEIKN